MIGSLNSIEKYNPELNMWLVVRSSCCIRPGLVACPLQRGVREPQELLLVGGYDSSEQEQKQIRTLNLKSPDYAIRSILEMDEQRVFAAAAVL